MAQKQKPEFESGEENDCGNRQWTAVFRLLMERRKEDWNF